MNLPTRIGNPISFCAVALKASKVAGLTFLADKEDKTNGDKKKHLTYLDGKQSRIVAFLKRLH